MALNSPGRTLCQASSSQVKETLSEDHKPDSWLWSLGCLKNSYIHLRADFEATCDREPGKMEKEVLAIPVVLLDTDTEADTELTGITNAVLWRWEYSGI